MEFKFDEAKTWLEDENGKQVAVLDPRELRGRSHRQWQTAFGKRG